MQPQQSQPIFAFLSYLSVFVFYFMRLLDDRVDGRRGTEEELYRR
jgi:hypothetical protein